MVPETNMPVRFYLSPNREDGSASVLVSEPLDYETTPFFYLRVRAQNVAAVPLAAFTTVYINVTGGIWASSAHSNGFCSSMCFLDGAALEIFSQSVGYVTYIYWFGYSAVCASNTVLNYSYCLLWMIYFKCHNKCNAVVKRPGNVIEHLQYAQQFGLDSGALFC